MNLPDYNFLSAPLSIITVLHVVTLSLHFIAMNFLLGGVIIVLWGRFTDRWNDPTVKQFIKLFPTAMAITITTGVAPLLFLQLVYPKQMYSAAIVSGWYWLLIIPVLVVAYYCLYSASFPQKENNNRMKFLLLIAFLGFVYVSFIYTSVFSQAENPKLIHDLYSINQSGLLINPHFNTYYFRWLHMIFGAMTVGGYFVGYLGKDNEQAFRIGKRFFLTGMIMATLFGLGYLFTLGEILGPFMHSWVPHVLLLGAVLSFGSLHFFFKKRFFDSGAMIFVSMLAMVITRHTVRLFQLKDQYNPFSIPVSPQWSVFVIFLLFFILALALIAIMFRLYFRKKI